MEGKVSQRPNGLHNAKKLKLGFRLDDLDLPERRMRYASRQKKEHVPTMMCPCGPQLDSRTHIIRGCEIYNEERDVLDGGMTKLDVCDILEFRRLKFGGETIAIIRERLWPQAAKQDQDGIDKQSMCNL